MWSLPVYFAGHLAVKDAARLLADAERALSAYNASVPGLRGLQLLSVPKLLALGERVGGARVGLVYTQRAYQMIKAIYGVAIGGIVHTKLEGPMQEAADITGHLGALSEFFGAGNIGGILSAASQVEAVLALADRAESVMQDRADWNQVPRILRKIARRVQFRHACLLKWCKECKK